MIANRNINITSFPSDILQILQRNWLLKPLMILIRRHLQFGTFSWFVSWFVYSLLEILSREILNIANPFNYSFKLATFALIINQYKKNLSDIHSTLHLTTKKGSRNVQLSFSITCKQNGGVIVRTPVNKFHLLLF